MATINTKSIRNVSLLGHGGSGKTSVAEAMLFAGKATERLGRTPDGNTVCDYDPEEIKRGFSLSLSVAPVMWKDIKINILDTPGYLDFAGEVMQGLRAADSVIITVDGKAGLEVGTELAWDYAEDAGIPKSFFINKCDDPEAHFDKVFAELRDAFGVSVCPLFVPMKDGKDIDFINLIDLKAIKYDAKGNHTESSMPAQFADVVNEYRNILYESIAETSEELMEKFFAEEEITREEALMAIHEGIINGSIVPVFCGSATNQWGIDILLDTITESYPRHTAKKNEKIISDEGIKDYPINAEGETAVFVFKTVADPFVGKMSFFKVMNGTLKRDMTLKNNTTGGTEKMAHIYTIRGKKQTEVDELSCGDIGVTAKLANTNTNDTLTASSEIKFKPIEFPEPFMCQAIQPLAKGDEDKISTGITKLLEEDLTIKYENNAETKQMLIYGLGDIHLDVVVSKLKTRFGTSVQLTEPRLAYREKIKKKVQVEGKHKKQSGGHGQYGHVKIEFSPATPEEGDGLIFTESIFGGSVPKNFHPAVEKGLLEAMLKGVAGYPMVQLKANLYDGSYHDVDSSEMSFKMAASLAYKECLKQANPVILEPVGSLKVLVPDSMVGDVISDLNKRRGRVLGMNADDRKKGYTVVEADVPKGEMSNYTISLRAMSQGRGKFVYRVERYEEAPSSVAEKIKAAAEKEKDED